MLNKRKVTTFDDIKISIVVEKELDNTKVPIPLDIDKTDKKEISAIAKEIENAKNTQFSSKDIVLNKNTKKYEAVYYMLPGFLRRLVWKLMLNNPKIAYKKMGNVVVSSVGMMGHVKGWFIQHAVHPISFGIGSILEKPAMHNGNILIREILNITILINHDVIDGVPMTKFIQELTDNIEKGYGL